MDHPISLPLTDYTLQNQPIKDEVEDLALDTINYLVENDMMAMAKCVEILLKGKS